MSDENAMDAILDISNARWSQYIHIFFLGLCGDFFFVGAKTQMPLCAAQQIWVALSVSNISNASYGVLGVLQYHHHNKNSPPTLETRPYSVFKTGSNEIFSISFDPFAQESLPRILPLTDYSATTRDAQQRAQADHF